MTLEDLRYLQSKDAQHLLETYKATPLSDLPRLTMKLKKKGFDKAHLITHQLELRQKAEAKFTRAHEMLFTKEGLEQATSESIAQYIAHRIHTSVPSGPVMDGTCGIGGNLIALAQYRPVIARDVDPVTLELAQHNAYIYGVDRFIQFECVPAEQTPSQPVAAIFLDPARAQHRTSKTRSLTNTEPSITEIIPLLYFISTNLGIKISPAFDYEELDMFSDALEVELIGHQKRNAVAMLWFGELAHTERSATIMHPDGPYHLASDSDSHTSAPQITELQAYLYDPHPAIRKAHLIQEVANQYQLSQIDPWLSLLTRNDYINFPHPFRVFRVWATYPFSNRHMDALINEYHLTHADIMTRGFRVSPDKLREKFNLDEGGPYTLLFATIQGKEMCIILSRLSSVY